MNLLLFLYIHLFACWALRASCQIKQYCAFALIDTLVIFLDFLCRQIKCTMHGCALRHIKPIARKITFLLLVCYSLANLPKGINLALLDFFTGKNSMAFVQADQYVTKASSCLWGEFYLVDIFDQLNKRRHLTQKTTGACGSNTKEGHCEFLLLSMVEYIKYFVFAPIEQNTCFTSCPLIETPKYRRSGTYSFPYIQFL